MKMTDDRFDRLGEAMREAYNNPPAVRPGDRWRKGVMAEIRASGARAPGRMYVPPMLFRLSPLLAAASVAAFIIAWSALYNDLLGIIMSDLSRTAGLYLLGL